MTETTIDRPSAVRRSVCAALVSLPAVSLAQLRVEITGVGSQQFPIAIAPFARDGQVPVEIESVVRADLARSGLFRIVDAGATPIPENAAVSLPDWKGRGADALAIGSVTRLADGRFDVRFRLLDTIRGSQLDGLSYVSPASDLRLTAHRIADRIYEKLTGERGVFATRIAYVVQTSRNSWELHIADADGANPQSALRSREPIISPAWSPDGSRLAYVSFETGKPVVYVHTVATGTRKAVANFCGSNSAPAWSPDGKSLAVTLTREGNSQVFLMDADGGNVRRLTTSSGIDTEPSFSPDGKSIAFVQRESGRFRIAVLEVDTGQVTVLTDGTLDDSPSYAPNGKMILYEAQVGGRGQLAAVSSDGRVRQRLVSSAGDVRDPAWGPLPTN